MPAGHPLGKIVPPTAYGVPAPGPLTTADGRRLTADDRLDLNEIIARWDLGYTSTDRELLDDTMTDDLIFEHPMGDAVGIDAMLAVGVPYFGLRHLFLNRILFINEHGEPTVACHMLVIQVAWEREGNDPVSFPHILDENLLRYSCRLVDSRWRICRLVFEQGRLSAYVGAPQWVYENFLLTAAQRAAAKAAGDGPATT